MSLIINSHRSPNFINKSELQTRHREISTMRQLIHTAYINSHREILAHEAIHDFPNLVMGAEWATVW
jgi:hypothetical protein